MLRTSPAPMVPGETLGDYRRLPADELARRTAERFAAGRIGNQPADFARVLFERWRADWTIRGADAMRDHVKRCDLLDAVRRNGIRADAFDAEIVQRAKDSARDATRRIERIAARSASPSKARRASWPAWQPDSPAVVLENTLSELRDWFEHLGLADAWARLDERSADGTRKRLPRSILLRVQCERWWRRTLRVVHGRAIENVARDIGLVHKRAGCYASDVSLRRRRAQRARNAGVLDATAAVNEYGQDITLAELSARNVSDPAIRRAELMTRIGGFEIIAAERDDLADFITVTCPSRMHAQRTAGFNGVEPNPRFDGTTPKQAQQWLAGQWSKVRNALARRGIHVYGFRIAEPNHDGTPHWHLLLFYPKVANPPSKRAGSNSGDGGASGHRSGRGKALLHVDDPRAELVRVLRKYFLLADSPTEPGAEKRRVKVVPIEPGKGTAAGYVAKYVAKNIDGYHVEKDLFGNDALRASERIETWASTHRIRQFQQVGGAPVTIYRELRRTNDAQAEHSATLALALDAVNIGDAVTAAGEEKPRIALAWATYLHMQGGPCVKRADLRMRLLNEPTGELNRYAEPITRRVVGVVADEVKRTTIHKIGIVGRIAPHGKPVHAPFDHVRRQRIEVESERCDWTIVPRNDVQQARARMLAVAPARGEAVRPWTRVNNCARRSELREAWASGLSARPLFPPAVVRHRRTGRMRPPTKGDDDG